MVKDRKIASLLKITILSISLMLSSASAISVTLPLMKAQFESVSSASIESLVTIPSFSMMVFILLSSFITNKIGKRKTVLLGLSLALVGGIIPVFTTDFIVIYVSRFVLGAGIGIYNSLAVSLIGDFFEGEEQKKLMGFQTAFSTIGSSLATFLAGIMVNYNWHYAYLVYFLAAPVIILFYFGFPKSETITSSQGQKVKQKENKQTVNLTGVFCFIMMYVFFIIVMTLFTKTGLAIAEINLANQEFLGTAFTVAGLVGSIGALCYGWVYKIFGKYTPVVASLLCVLSFFGIPLSSNMLVLTLLLVLANMSTALFIPYMYTLLLEGAPKGSENLAVSLAMVACNLGSFSSPYVLQILGNIFGNDSSIFSFTICSFIFLGMALVFLFKALKDDGRKNVMSFE